MVTWSLYSSTRIGLMETYRHPGFQHGYELLWSACIEQFAFNSLGKRFCGSQVVHGIVNKYTFATMWDVPIHPGFAAFGNKSMPVLSSASPKDQYTVIDLTGLDSCLYILACLITHCIANKRDAYNFIGHSFCKKQVSGM